MAYGVINVQTEEVIEKYISINRLDHFLLLKTNGCA